MDTQADLAARLALVEDRTAVADVIHRYAAGVRHGELTDAAGLFAEDGVFEIRAGSPRTGVETKLVARLEGREQILGYLNRSASSNIVCPAIHNLRIEIDGERAKSNCIMTATVLGGGPTLMGEYDDSFVRIDGAWRFAQRRYLMFRDFAQED